MADDAKPATRKTAVKRKSTAAPQAKAPARKTAAKKTSAKAAVKTAAKKTAQPAAPSRKTAAKKTAGSASTKASTKSAPKKKTASAKAQPATRTAAKSDLKATPSPTAFEQAFAIPESRPMPKSESPARPAASTDSGKKAEPPIYTDMARFAQYMADINVRTRDIMNDVAQRRAEMGRRGAETVADPLNIAEAGTEVVNALNAKPLKLLQMQIGLWDEFSRLYQSAFERMTGAAADPVAQPKPGDRRFQHKAWEENPMLDFIKQSYLIFSHWVDTTIQNAEGVDAATKRRAFFHADQILSAMSPSNVPGLNPDVVDETIATQGANWVNGMKNFMEDLERGHGELAIKQTDLDFFKVGENIATTPGKVVYENEILQLIQYNPTTETVAERPMIIFPPWINKFYILDLQPENSFIRWLIDQGRTVFVVSWVNPGPALRNKSFPDYMREGVFEALAAAERATGIDEFDTIGYCIGGTLLSVSLAYMAHHGDHRVKSATLFTAQSDFKESGDLLLFVDERQLANMEKQMDAAGGVLEGSAMARTFNMLRPNDMIWSAFVDNYYLGKEAKKFDLLYWNADATRMTKACHLFYLRKFYLENSLAKGELEIEGTPIDLSEVKIPMFMQAGEKDHIAPYNSVYRSARLFGGEVEYMLAGSGHIAGVINHPDRKKYHYSTNTSLPATVEEWMAGASRHDHSWWPYWIKWLNGLGNEQVPARVPGDGDLSVIEDAPGTYVRVRCD
ncbi:class I poly(R)-hydroxyalkanoic acid synthase [Parvularcula sp. LCG005]|uniref:class I poly(R)-hydroxyalkanoic acid synthase n=1 Tax=Parvularcula sp. LCG005 TaxID=3078805 RepID=UPI0029431EB1|nr:class I poly(R)-hydroxyalkanoic acid synthase [Parvularcula sp. LCG005]WOI54695.1 class I poly(R)-hydroxyalkanoic acid synthase [Parvularcula sp. LCG005]